MSDSGISAIIQARVGSSRLPNKVILPFYNGESILDILLRTLKDSAITDIIIATTDSKKDDVIDEFCKVNYVNCFRGNETDVLQRFINAAECYGYSKLLRICADNPFLDLASVNELVSAGSQSDSDYLGFRVNDKPSIKTHFGFWPEYVTLDALKKIKSLTSENIFREHVTNYIYTYPELFSINWLKVPVILDGREDIRLTIDTIDDFNTAKEIFFNLRSSQRDMTIKNIVTYLDKNIEYLGRMKTEIDKNIK